jgi:hypothetical protein
MQQRNRKKATGLKRMRDKGYRFLCSPVSGSFEPLYCKDGMVAELFRLYPNEKFTVKKL